MTISSSHGSTAVSHSSNLPSRRRLVWVRTNLSTVFCPSRLRFLEWIQDSTDHESSHPDEEHVIATRRVAAQHICFHSLRYTCAHLYEAIFCAVGENATIAFKSCEPHAIASLKSSSSESKAGYVWSAVEICLRGKEGVSPSLHNFSAGHCGRSHSTPEMIIVE